MRDHPPGPERTSRVSTMFKLDAEATNKYHNNKYEQIWKKSPRSFTRTEKKTEHNNKGLGTNDEDKLTEHKLTISKTRMHARTNLRTG